jgi:hypothetical protein
MLRGVGEPLPRRRAPGLARLGSGRTGRAANASADEARRGRSNRNRGADEGGRCL